MVEKDIDALLDEAFALSVRLFDASKGCRPLNCSVSIIETRDKKGDKSWSVSNKYLFVPADDLSWTSRRAAILYLIDCLIKEVLASCEEVLSLPPDEVRWANVPASFWHELKNDTLSFHNSIKDILPVP